MRRPLIVLLSGMFAVALVATTSLIGASPASAATAIAPTTTCSNGVDNTPGLGLICEVTVLNTITPTGGWASVTVRECHGAAGAPTASCAVVTSVLTAPVTAVTQCNDAINGGGGTLRCSVRVTNQFFGVSPGASAATVNQCVGSGGGITIGCNPFPATTTGATITQCNGSANGGTLVGLTCTATGTAASAHGVRINQCNGSANGGGSLVICSANIENRVVTTPQPSAPTAPTTGTPVTTTTTTTTSTSTTPTTPSGLPLLPDTSMSAPQTTTTTSGVALSAISIGLVLIASALLIAARRRAGRPS
jgi:hypothetical protein